MIIAPNRKNAGSKLADISLHRLMDIDYHLTYKSGADHIDLWHEQKHVGKFKLTDLRPLIKVPAKK